MAKRKSSITVAVRAKNAMAAGLSSASNSLKKFGGSALKIGRLFAKGFLIAGAAVAGFVAKSLSAYAQQEKAETALSAAMSARGDNAKQILPILKAAASQIQDETGAADEATLATMAQLRALGVLPTKLTEAAKATIALKSVGLEGASAQRAVALAMQGNYDMLNRYVPAIRNANTEQEKAAIFAKLVSSGYAQQKEELNTVSGQWSAFKGRIGDAMEQIGKAISQNSKLRDSLKKAGDKVKELGESFKEWMGSGGLSNAIATAKNLFSGLRHSFALISNAVKVAGAAITDGFDSYFNYALNRLVTWKDAAIANLKYVWAWNEAITKKMKNPFSEFKAPDKSEVIKANKAFVDGLKWSNSVISKRTKAALADRVKLHKEHAARLAKIAKEQTANLKKDKDAADKAKALADAAKMPASESVAVEKEKADKLNKMTKALYDKRKKAALNAAKEEKKAARDVAKAELKAIQDRRKAAHDLATTKVQDLIAQRRDQKRLSEESGKEAERAISIFAKSDKGIKLSKEDKEFYDAWLAVNQAKKSSDDLGRAESAKEGEVAFYGKYLDKINTTLGEIKTQNNELLRMQ